MTTDQLHDMDKRFDEKVLTYDKDGGFCHYVEDYDNMDFNTDLIKAFIHEELARQNAEHQKLILEAEQECKILILEQLLPKIVYPHDQREVEHLLKKLKAGNK